MTNHSIDRIKISAIIAAKKEAKTIIKTLNLLYIALEYTDWNYEIIIICADEETYQSARKFQTPSIPLHVLRDTGVGKPGALNQGFKLAKGDYLLLTDGDVFLENKKFLRVLFNHFKKDNKVGLVAGLPKPLNKKNNKYGYWADLTSRVIHRQRKMASRKGDFFSPSGYLYATLRRVTPKLPKSILADDHYIASYIHTRNHKLIYESKAVVNYWAPTSLRDFYRQKRRTFIGIYQSQRWYPKLKAKRNIYSESVEGIRVLLKSKLKSRQYYWTLELYIVRFVVWILAYFQFHLNQRNLLKLWTEIRSTKKK